MKTCFKCKQEKQLDDFYKHAMMADGHLNKCKECAKIDVYNHRNGESRDKVLAYDRERSKTNKKRIENSRKYQAIYRVNNKKKKHAQSVLRYAVVSGKIQKLHCFVCGKDAEAHHPDYDRPLDVVWLCSAHHHQTHAMV